MTSFKKTYQMANYISPDYHLSLMSLSALINYFKFSEYDKQCLCIFLKSLRIIVITEAYFTPSLKVSGKQWCSFIGNRARNSVIEGQSM